MFTLPSDMHAHYIFRIITLLVLLRVDNSFGICRRRFFFFIFPFFSFLFFFFGFCCFTAHCLLLSILINVYWFLWILFYICLSVEKCDFSIHICLFFHFRPIVKYLKSHRNFVGLRFSHSFAAVHYVCALLTV